MSSVLSRFAETGIQLMNIGLSVWTHQRCPPISNELIRVRPHRGYAIDVRNGASILQATDAVRNLS